MRPGIGKLGEGPGVHLSAQIRGRGIKHIRVSSPPYEVLSSSQLREAQE